MSKKKQKHTHAYYDTPQKIKKTKILGNIQMNNVKIPKVFQARSYMNISLLRNYIPVQAISDLALK